MIGTPPSLDRLLAALARGESDADMAWQAFVSENSRLLVHVARSVTGSHDDAMDAYVFVLEQLRADRCRRLRDFAANPRSKLSTWLVVVARRLCLDLYRHRYGRSRGEPGEQRVFRRRLQDLLGEPIEPSELPAPRSGRAELAVREAELLSGLDYALATLAPGDRLLIRLRFEDDLPAQEIARVIGFPTPHHVYRRINVILAGLREVLRARGIESAVP